MIFGREITLPLQALILQPRETTMDQGTSDDYMDHLKNKLEQNHAITRKSLKRVSQYQKRRYDLKAKKQSFKKGQSVWIYEPTRKIGVCSKFASKWKGPFIVEKKIDDVSYRVKRNTRQPSSVYHVDRLALYNGRNIRHGHHDFGGTSLRRQTTNSKFIFRGRYLHEGDPEDSDLFNFLF
jgi:hypothetical protein